MKITNMDIPEELWLKQFTREELRSIAKAHKICLGRSGSARQTARGLAKGWGVQKVMRVFPMRLSDTTLTKERGGTMSRRKRLDGGKTYEVVAGECEDCAAVQYGHLCNDLCCGTDGVNDGECWREVAAAKGAES